MLITNKNMFLIELDKKGILSESKFRQVRLREIRGITTPRVKKIGKEGGFIVHTATHENRYRLDAVNEELLAEIIKALQDKMDGDLSLYAVDGNLGTVKGLPENYMQE